ncbi:LON peptidase substrate-binding domain-containing protein [Pseudomonas sp. RIT-PI-AD]|uniref:LON peptidase substrate-binding domain-containing protein n=1 Tax=Pseudomonas sp. RIT-PI-AD TaxID=3035294 RepID=UPI0021DB4C3A|nr:LON peptidase substrate-binding domain-containing protein [Pseudomonas sp. RIT-PI-AD]
MNLPLFPLNTVLFPGCVLDLQIFEARYLDMLSRCLRQGHGFGVVTLLEGHEVGEAPSRFSGLGCEALIRDWQQRPNGLLGLRVQGGRRLRIARTEVQRDQSILAEVEWLPECPDSPVGSADADLLALLGALAEHPMVAALDMGGQVDTQAALAHRLAYLLPFEPEQKLELLGLDAPEVALARVQSLLERLQGDSLG